MPQKCSVCQQSNTTLKNIHNTKIGIPKITIKDLLLQCFEDADSLPNNIGKSSEKDSYLCNKCEIKLLEFYDANLLVSKKRDEFQALVRTSNSGNVDSIKETVELEDKEPWAVHVSVNEDSNGEDEWEIEFKPDINSCLMSNNEESEDEHDSLAMLQTRLQSAKAMRYCRECEIECPTEAVYQLHMTKIHAAIQFSTKSSLCCPECYVELPTEHAYKEHMKKKHPKLGPFKCNICDRTFTNEVKLISHHEMHSELTCTHCDTTFAQKRALREHMEVQHPDIKEFQCDQCGNLYSSSKSLKKHKMVHSNARNFKCDECPRQFRNSSHLKRHKLTHSGLKPHVCPICYRTFAQKYNMSSHMKEHSKPGNLTRRPECSNCGQFFTAQQFLEQHLALGGCVMAKVEGEVYLSNDKDDNHSKGNVAVQSNEVISNQYTSFNGTLPTFTPELSSTATQNI